MAPRKEPQFETRVIHAAQDPGSWEGATLPPIFQTASHAHPTAENLSRTFGGKTTDHIYMRLTNPTNKVLEQKLAALENGMGAVVMASGMAAITNACLALLRTGDEFVTGNSLFMSSYVLFANIFKKYGITARFVESTDMAAIEAAINDKTRFIWLETIGNPKMDVPDLTAAAEIAHRYGLPLLVDNTMATPCLCRPIRAESLSTAAGSTGPHQAVFPTSNPLSTGRGRLPTWTRSGGSTTSTSAPPRPPSTPT
jgi:O-acetylhomoserine (thiol)-lyase